MKIRKIGVLYGGQSAEREISIKTGAAVIKALKEEGYTVIPIDTKKKDFIKKLVDSKIDIAFITLHGPLGEDGTIQGLLEVLKIPYTGSGVLSSALAMDKVYTKRIFESCGIQTPKWQVVYSGGQLPASNFRFPAVVKPARQGSAIGVSIVKKKSGLKKALEEAFKYGNCVIVEQYIKGVEITVPVLGEKALVPIEIVPVNSFYDFHSKYAKGGSKHLIPPNLPKKTIEKAKQLGVQAHNALGCRALSRIDMIVDEKGSIYVLEANTIPGMTETSLFPDAAKAEGMSFGNLLKKIIKYSIDDKQVEG